MPACRACRVLAKGLSPIWSSTTSFPWALSFLATARTSKAVSAVRLRAKALRVSSREGDSSVFMASCSRDKGDKGEWSLYKTLRAFRLYSAPVFSSRLGRDPSGRSAHGTSLAVLDYFRRDGTGKRACPLCVPFNRRSPSHSVNFLHLAISARPGNSTDIHSSFRKKSPWPNSFTSSAAARLKAAPT